ARQSAALDPRGHDVPRHRPRMLDADSDLLRAPTRPAGRALRSFQLAYSARGHLRDPRIAQHSLRSRTLDGPAGNHLPGRKDTHDLASRPSGLHDGVAATSAPSVRLATRFLTVALRRLQ